MSTLQIGQRHLDGVTILDLNGPITMGESGASLRRLIRSLVEQDRKMILLDLEKVSYIDSSGLGELVAGYSSIEKNGGEMKIVKLSQRVTELMTITKLVTVFDIFDDQDTALKSFTRNADDVSTGPLAAPSARGNSIA